MSRLRRLALSDRFFYIACRLLPHRRALKEPEFERLARVVREGREKQEPERGGELQSRSAH